MRVLFIALVLSVSVNVYAKKAYNEDGTYKGCITDKQPPHYHSNSGTGNDVLRTDLTSSECDAIGGMPFFEGEDELKMASQELTCAQNHPIGSGWIGPEDIIYAVRGHVRYVHASDGDVFEFARGPHSVYRYYNMQLDFFDDAEGNIHVNVGFDGVPITGMMCHRM